MKYDKEKLTKLAKELEIYKIKANAPMAEYTSFRIGGPADLLFMPSDREQLEYGIKKAKELDVPYMIIGNGSNLLVSDSGTEGLVIRIAGDFSGIEYSKNKLKARAGTLISAAAKDSVEHGLMGLEWAAGIPGTVGGAVAMNAGAYGGEIKQVLTKVEYIEDGAVCSVEPEDSDLGYRFSRFAAPERIVLSAEFSLSPDDGMTKERMKDYSERRRAKQPLTYPSAGSTFKRPTGYYAGALIEQADLKGVSVGGAEVSTLHAGFIINKGGATSEDVKRLIELVQERVYENSGVTLETEVKFIGR